MPTVLDLPVDGDFRTSVRSMAGGNFDPGSVAIDQIPEADCVDAGGEPLTTDQRGEPRPAVAESNCDVGSFEVQPEAPPEP